MGKPDSVAHPNIDANTDAKRDAHPHAISQPHARSLADFRLFYARLQRVAHPERVSLFNPNDLPIDLAVSLSDAM